MSILLPPVLQVQCQRVHMFIPGPETGMPKVTCPYCPDQETYQRLGAQHLGWLHVEHATHMCRAEFNVANDRLTAAVWMGERPETIFEEHLNRHNIYLGRCSDPWQIMYSGSHEAFHRVCGAQKNAYHWADEMFAVLFSLLYLERIDEAEHAAINRAMLVTEAAQCSSQQMFALTETPLPDGLYGRAYLVGVEIREIVGWDTLKNLAVIRTVDGYPDVDRWLDTLSREKHKKVSSVLRT